ncbi:MAG: hypothetical protein BM485_16385 [Desulfobulbaceae bacterium DB1]|nr:MAG: hypothetical protein BM485_16385 [Desulfobulbaceae bacterium DB1]
MSKKVCFMYPSSEYILDGVRSALGLAVENMYAYGVVMNTEITDEQMTEYHKENIDWIRDMEGEIFTIPDGNVEKHGLVKMTLEELGQKLREMEYIVPYGIMRSDKS